MISLARIADVGQASLPVPTTGDGRDQWRQGTREMTSVA